MAEKFDRGLENREIVLDILTEVLENGAFVHQVLGQALYKYQYLDKADRAFITRAAEGTLDYLIPVSYTHLDVYKRQVRLHTEPGLKDSPSGEAEGAPRPQAEDPLPFRGRGAGGSHRGGREKGV